MLKHHQLDISVQNIVLLNLFKTIWQLRKIIYSVAEENDMDLVFLILSVMQYTNDRHAEK